MAALMPVTCNNIHVLINLSILVISIINNVLLLLLLLQLLVLILILLLILYKSTHKKPTLSLLPRSSNNNTGHSWTRDSCRDIYIQRYCTRFTLQKFPAHLPPQKKQEVLNLLRLHVQRNAM
jgi:hypothetical protein